MKRQRETAGDDPVDPVKIAKATWMADGTHWPGTWIHPSSEHTRGDHAGIIQVSFCCSSNLPPSFSLHQHIIY